jgi:DNA-binding Lrp family transcriptional regulator
MQETIDFEREAHESLPDLVAGFLAEPRNRVRFEASPPDSSADLSARTPHGRFIFELKASGRPGVVEAGARQLRSLKIQNVVPVLVVPYMTPAGARAADKENLNWIDLSGNAHFRTDDFYVHVEGKPNKYPTRGPTPSPFAPRSSRIAHAMLLNPRRWWRQAELAEELSLNDGYVSRIVRRLEDEKLLERDHKEVRPRDPDLMLDAWVDDYRFDRHRLVVGHATGSGVDLSRTLNSRLEEAGVDHAFTGLASAWAYTSFVRFRMNSIYVAGDPYDVADAIELRRHATGANVQLIGPDDDGVFLGRGDVADLPCVSAIQTYLDLQHLPERAEEAAVELRDNHLLWPDDD